MSEDVDLFDGAVPPSPIAATALMSQPVQGIRPNPPVAELEISGLDDDLTIAAGQALRNAVNRPTTSTQRRHGGLQDWLIHDQSMATRPFYHRIVLPDDAEVIELDNGDSNDDSTESDDVISIDEGDSDIERVEDSSESDVMSINADNSDNAADEIGDTDGITQQENRENLLEIPAGAHQHVPIQQDPINVLENPNSTVVPVIQSSSMHPQITVPNSSAIMTTTSDTNNSIGNRDINTVPMASVLPGAVGSRTFVGTSVQSDLYRISTERTNVGSDQPSVSGDQPNDGSDQPSVSGDQPNVGSDQPSFSADQPNVGSDHLSAIQSTTAETRSQGSSSLPEANLSGPPSTPVQPQGASGGPQNPVVSLIASQGTSPADFRSPKRKRVASPECSLAGDAKVAEEEEGDSCPICFEHWTNSGLHRLCALRCGHLFGQSCIEKWLKGQGGKCPHCNAKAKRQDIRVIYAKTIKAMDTSERDRALKDLEKEREGRRKAEMETAQLRLQCQMAIGDNNRLKLEIENLRTQLRFSGGQSCAAGPSVVRTHVDTKISGSQAQIAGQFVLDKTIKIWDAGQCRVMAYCPSLATLVASQPSASPLFPGFGVKKISTLDFKSSQYLTIHSKAIRDLAFHPAVEDGMLLSCGLDKKVKMTSLLSNAVVQTYDTPMPAWSCVWNTEDRNYFYAGLQNGQVLEFDVRNTESHVQEINTDGTRSPVVSLSYMSRDSQADFRSGGLLVGQLDRVSFFDRQLSGQYKLHILPLEGNLTSLHVEDTTRHVLASYRPTAKHPTIRHQLCEMLTRNISTDATVIDNVCTCNVVHTFHGGRTQAVLSKTILIQHPGDQNRLLVCAGDESNNSVHVWDSATGQLSQRLITGGVTVDLCSFTMNNTVYLATLTDKLCKVYKWS